MGAVTWKNIAPVSSAGILDSINEAGQQIGTGIGGIGDAITGYADDRTTRETDAFKLELMAAADEQARQDLITGADRSWLDLGAVSEANEKASVFDDWYKKFEYEQAGRERVADINAKKKISVKGYGKTAPGKYFKDSLGGFDDDTFGFGHGFDQDDQIELDDKKMYIAGKWGKGSDPDITKTISEKDWNAFSTQRLTFKDEFFDDFEFMHNGKRYDLDDAPDNVLYDAIMQFKGNASEKSIDEGIAFTQWLTTQPESMKNNLDASNIFKETAEYNKIQYKYNQKK
jgi:hypothetical protein